MGLNNPPNINADWTVIFKPNEDYKGGAKDQTLTLALPWGIDITTKYNTIRIKFSAQFVLSSNNNCGKLG